MRKRQKLGESGNGSMWEATAEIERNTDNYGIIKRVLFLPRWTSFHLFFSYPPAKSNPPRPFISPRWPSSSDPLSVWLFVSCLPLSPPPPFTSDTFPFFSGVSSPSFICLCSLPPLSSLFFASPLPPQGQSIAAERGDALALDSLTPIRADTLRPYSTSLRTSFCRVCFSADDTPLTYIHDAKQTLTPRHSTLPAVFVVHFNESCFSDSENASHTITLLSLTEPADDN